MNYRHAYHAGNFADLAKHATLLALLDLLQAQAGPLTVIDTHAGAGLYNLDSPEALKTSEAAAGIVRLMAASDAPEGLQSLRGAVARLNPKGAIQVYPGSPRLIADRLSAQDRLIACEARADDCATLRKSLRGQPGIEVARVDGWRHGLAKTPKLPARLLVLIDPPYEAGDDRAQAARLVGAIHKINPEAVIVVWAPIKDLAAFDTLVWGLQDATPGTPVLIAEARLRPLSDPLRLNGAALVIFNAPADLEPRARAIATWVAGLSGEGGDGRVRWGA